MLGLCFEHLERLAACALFKERSLSTPSNRIQVRDPGARSKIDNFHFIKFTPLLEKVTEIWPLSVTVTPLIFVPTAFTYSLFFRRSGNSKVYHSLAVVPHNSFIPNPQHAGTQQLYPVFLEISTILP